MNLADVAQKTNLNFISVPQENHKIIYKNKEISLKDLIEKEFLEEQKQHTKAPKDLPTAEKNSFSKKSESPLQSKK